MTAEAPSPRRPVLVVFTSHWLAMTGLGIVLTSIIVWSCLLPVTLKHGQDNPYVGLAMTAVGAALVLGLLLTPLGLFLGRRKLKQQVETAVADHKMAWRRLILFLVVVSLFNVLIASQVATKAVHAMETRQFCGSCHVMTPQARAFELGPHGSLQCVE